MDILEEIVANKRLEVARQKESVSFDMLLSLGEQQFNNPVNSMCKSLSDSFSGIIAEFKRRSPSKGWLFQNARIEDILPSYQQAGASACSILTDYYFFGGSFGDLKHAHKYVNLPVLRKDFIIDEYQLYQSRALGADAVLLIAACLNETECQHLSRIAKQIGLEVLLEIHSEEEISFVNEDITMIGVNNRNLGTFNTNIANSFNMIEKLKKEAGNDFLLVSESGISDAKDIIQLRQAGYRGFLLGETFMKTPDPGAKLFDLINKL